MLEVLGTIALVLWSVVALLVMLVWKDYKRLGLADGKSIINRQRQEGHGHHAWEREHDYLRVVFCGQVGIDEVVTDISEGECPNCGSPFTMEDLLNETG